MNAPVGKSGPLIAFRRSAMVASGLSTSISTALATSRRLWGGMLVAMPTAMPLEPLTRRLGILEGRTVGSWSRSSKFDRKSTVFLSMSSSMATATRVSRASVYR